MVVLNFLVDSFVGAFGITPPRPEQRQTVALVLGGTLLLAILTLAALLAWMLFGVRH